MPISKRDKKESLTKTKKKGQEHKRELVTEIQGCVDKHKRVFVLSVQNMRNAKMRDVRQQWAGSRFFFGKNKVMSFALGKSQESEYAQNLHKVSEVLKGQSGLLFTDTSEADVQKWFDEYVIDEYARSGNVATHKVVLKQGPIPSFGHSIEPQLKQLGLATTLNRGVVTLLKDHTVCNKGDVLNPEQARILKLFDHKMAKFQVKVDCVWTKSKNHFKLLKSKKDRKPTSDTEVVIIEGAELKHVEGNGGMDVDEEMVDE